MCNNTDKCQFIQKHIQRIINTAIVRNFGLRYKRDFNVCEKSPIRKYFDCPHFAWARLFYMLTLIVK